MKKIGIDARLYYQTGVGVYIRNLLYYLKQLNPKNLQFYVYLLEKDINTVDLKSPLFIKRGVNAKWHSFAEQTSLYHTLQKDNLDLMHFTYFSYPVLYRRPFVATIHDVTPLLFKTGKASTHNQMFYEIKHVIFKFVLSQQVKNAQTIITPTKSVRNQLIDIYGDQIADKTMAIYEGVNHELTETKENTSLKKDLDKLFFIYIGNFYPHKNVDKLVDAWKLLHHHPVRQLENDSGSTQLILIGPENYFSQQLKGKIEKEHIPNIRFYHDASIEDLVFFYKHAQALINPSLSEGFGLPVIEAAHFGLPVIASNLDVFEELLGNDYVSFDPENVEDIASKLQITNYKLRIKNINTKYSFKRMTEEIVEIYKGI